MNAKNEEVVMNNEGKKASLKNADIFGPGSNVSKRWIKDYQVLSEIVEALRKLDLKIALTSGSFDMVHEGHFRYLEQGKGLADILIVGVDSDDKVRKRKGVSRPFDGELTRLERLCHLRHVDLVFLKPIEDEKWKLIKIVKPDALLLTAETYSSDKIEMLKQYCSNVVVLPAQAATSTTARIRSLMVRVAGARMRETFEQAKTNMMDELGKMETLMDEIFGDGKER